MNKSTRVTLHNAKRKNIRANASSHTERVETISLIKSIGKVIKENNNIVISKENQMKIRSNIINNQKTKILMRTHSKNNTSISIKETIH